MKKLIVLVVIISILSAAIPVMAAEEDAASPYLTDAEKLNAIGLFLGTDIGFELHRVPRRAEAAVMLVRLLGLESEALGGGYIHPFTDVPEWADPYVGLLYQNELTKGIGGNLYDPYSDVDAKTYLTFVMRALGYSDDEGDFSWESAVDDALGSGLINSLEHDVLSVEVFTRGHMAAMSYNALNSLMKDTRVTLAASLIESGAVDLVKAIEENFLLGPSLEK
ncbi:MAG: hypothetical protein R3232_11995, partial [Clostridia bacterium]|nr:hypothetical protein [Clostridia bacterium]